jgi:hypothetical protein
MLALLIALTLLGQDGRDAPAPQEHKTCLVCGGTGVVPCKKHGRDIEELEKDTTFCSFLVACPDCEGTLQRRCDRCKNRSPEYEAKRDAAHAWRQAREARFDAVMGHALNHAESAHFALVYDIPKLAIGQKAFDAHRGMHLYLSRLESFWRDFAKDLGAQDGDFLSKTTVLLWSARADQEKASLKYTLQPSSTESKLLGKAPIFSIFYDKVFLHEEAELHQAVVHQTTHCLLSNLWDGLWPGTLKGGWFDEGLAHVYEIRYFGGVRHYCYREQDTLGTFKFGKWQSETRTLIQQRAGESLLRPLYKNTDLLTPEEHILSWSFCEFLITNHADKMGGFARAAKQGLSPGDASRNVLLMSPAAVEEAWIEYVKKSYSTQK